MSAMKYYIYLSRAKLDMLAQQLAFHRDSSREMTFKAGVKDFVGWEGKITTEKDQLTQKD